jgi:hypothetical protein
MRRALIELFSQCRTVGRSRPRLPVGSASQKRHFDRGRGSRQLMVAAITFSEASLVLHGIQKCIRADNCSARVSESSVDTTALPARPSSRNSEGVMKLNSPPPNPLKVNF